MKEVPTTVEPTVRRVAEDRWLAVAGDDAPLRCGSWGATEEDARSRFTEDWDSLVAILQSTDSDA